MLHYLLVFIVDIEKSDVISFFFFFLDIFRIFSSLQWSEKMCSLLSLALHLMGPFILNTHILHVRDLVTERSLWWLWLLAAQKPINRPGWSKGSLLYFRCQQLGWGRGRRREWWTSVQGPTPPLPNKQGVRAFIDRGGQGGSTCRNSTVISNSHL